jgi:ribosomal protein S3
LVELELYAKLKENLCRFFVIRFLQLLSRQLAEDGYAGIEVRVTPVRTEIIIKATRTQDVLGEKGQRIRELTSVVQKRYKVIRRYYRTRHPHYLFDFCYSALIIIMSQQTFS